MLTPYLTFNGTCEEAFNFYADVFGGGDVKVARENNDLDNPVMHASVTFSKYDNCTIMGADVESSVVVSGMAICFVLPSKEVIEEVSEELARDGSLVQAFLPHPPPHENDGGAEIIDKYGYTWYLST